MNANDSSKPLRSRQWFDNQHNPGMTALYLERQFNFGFTRAELRSGRPIIGIAQTGSDIAPCNRHHLELAKRVRDGIIASGGVPFEFPVHPIQETLKRPTAGLDRNLQYLTLVEILHGYPIDGVVLLGGCDKTTPALLMGAATVDIPAILLNGGPMLNGWNGEKRVGSGVVLWEARKDHAAGAIDYRQFIDIVSEAAPSVGHCNTMGTASTMNALAEALGMSLPGSAAIPAPYRQRAQSAYDTGCRIVDMVREDLKPSDIMNRQAFENAIVVNSAIGGSTNAPVHLTALARHLGVDLPLREWQRIGYGVPLLVNLQPTGEYLCEDYYRAGGLLAVMQQLLEGGLLHADLITANGRTVRENLEGAAILNDQVIRPLADPLITNAGFLVMQGNLFDSAILKTSGISEEFRGRYLSNAEDPMAFVVRAIVFDGPEDYHARIEDPDLGADEHCALVMRGAGPVGYPGSAEVVNMQPPAALLKRGITSLPCLGDGRQSGTSGSPSILNASPEAAAGGNLALLRSGDKLRIDFNVCRVDVLLTDAEMQARRAHLDAAGGYPVPQSQTPWQEIQRGAMSQLDAGMVLEPAVRYQRIAKQLPRDNH
ncbi:IlvD/Edd family dehydratase [Pseudorhodoferax sp. Leaf265]|uniref:IlvD/Edd family dehydratase n=1 Tax=Pseudorhodoferax sp. Leaf265 TaxID=1736315 RepID=UPI0006F5C564|nr:IlvD/Edd family dehydratase [Pseudorhodoferax sp. Leaf265]KQP12381.1 dihydroxy-acid dehydratase [Pseudorhodoferax sp. Leaf265]